MFSAISGTMSQKTTENMVAVPSLAEELKARPKVDIHSVRRYVFSVLTPPDLPNSVFSLQ